MDNSIEVFTKLQTMGFIIVPLFAICLFGILKDELGLDDTVKSLAETWKSFKRRLNSTKIVTKLSKPDEMELRVLSMLQTYFSKPNHLHTVTQHSRHIHRCTPCQQCSDTGTESSFSIAASVSTPSAAYFAFASL